MRRAVLILSFGVLLAVHTVAQQQSPEAPVRVYVEGTHGHKFVAGVDHAIPVPDAAMHNQQMELAKTFLQRCPDVLPTVNKEKADYIVTLNWAPQTRIFLGGKLIHKPDQIMLTTRDGDVLYSNVARSVGGDVDAVCRLINRRKVGGPVDSSAAQIKAEGTNQATQDQQRINEEFRVRSRRTVDDPNPTATASTQAAGQTPHRAENNGGAWLGASSTDSPKVRHNGIRLSGVERDGPAYDAGLQTGDVILRVDGEYIYTVEELSDAIQKHAPGSRVTIAFMRGTGTYEASVLLGKQAKF